MTITKPKSKISGVLERVPGSGIWWVRYTDATGKRRYEKAGRHGDAVTLLSKRRTEKLQRKKLPEQFRGGLTFGQIADDAVAHSSEANGEKTTFELKNRLGIILPAFDKLPAERITKQDIQNWLLKTTDEREWSPATRNRYQATFSLVYRVALDNEKLAVNPASRIRRKAEDNDRIRFLSSDEEQVLVAVLHDRWPHYLPVFHISLHTGMRTSEQIGLTWRDVTLEGKMLTLHKTKAKKTRHIPLNSVAMTAFRELEAAAKSAGHAVNHHSHVFLNTEGNPLRSTREWFEPAVRLAGLVDYTWHCNRHTFASRLVQAGVNMRRVAYLMGHSTIQMTMRYAHLAPDSNQEAVDRLVSPSLQVATKLAQEVSKSS